MSEEITKDLAAIGVEEIMELIPHRYPMLLIDQLTEIEPAEAAVGIKCVTMNEEFFQGHFPGKPVMPGVLIVEAMAQTAAALVMYSLKDEAGKKLVYFMSIDGAKFRKPVVPGDRLELHIRKDRNRGPVWRFTAEGKVNGKVVAEATYTAMIADE
ncbi:3-hydroxyacyl-ACP dehydratase FabZ [Paremcibacter congregatus]|uniref:3-hydroxyacyl-[acyl-carrier-protein] dehydratase FabZ n=1 Tax=Paremcibacter congregatus TaxID=2043170 RepID=A0A2G4YSN6_9PROT|nr:3-hydroxyacyl-ACP dehydratase FabZ [Paremcibacter congregatus]PHZ85348.1 3-hydroxyacyl-[acyl-carrier-protein] dehydratase FabZ [Paremcibacter congregatus]QDE27721.1 3-hydroxyacyl-ACP dehydratase FabZ [Paremcibacter congregatus]|tara:strand:- start:38372 stop:38836 length:465 start_codon:yes stop_codon:yes gene_type:complete